MRVNYWVIERRRNASQHSVNVAVVPNAVNVCFARLNDKKVPTFLLSRCCR